MTTNVATNGVTMSESNYERRIDIFSRSNFPGKATVFPRKPRALSFLLLCTNCSQRTMVYDISWIIPKLRRPTSLWNFASTITYAAVGIVSKIIITWLNKTTVHNRQVLEKALEHRPRNVPLITVSNHHSCFDDPGIWGGFWSGTPPDPLSRTLNFKHLLNRRKMRWSLAAHDICFTNVWHSYFFMMGKCIPVIRGNGVYQEAINFCLEKLSRGEWIHVFPEGKVNMLKENLRLKWGIGRLIFESPVLPIVLPIYHLGMDDVLPNEAPYVIQMFKKVTVNCGEPIDFSEVVSQLKKSEASDEEIRKTITDRIDAELSKLKGATEKLHIQL